MIYLNHFCKEVTRKSWFCFVWSPVKCLACWSESKSNLSRRFANICRFLNFLLRIENLTLRLSIKISGSIVYVSLKMPRNLSLSYDDSVSDKSFIFAINRHSIEHWWLYLDYRKAKVARWRNLNLETVVISLTRSHRSEYLAILSYDVHESITRLFVQQSVPSATRFSVCICEIIKIIRSSNAFAFANKSEMRFELLCDTSVKQQISKRELLNKPNHLITQNHCTLKAKRYLCAS